MNRLPAIAIVALTALAAGLGALLLGGEPASSAPGAQPVVEQNLDANGFIKVHEQGTATVGIRGMPTVKVAADEPFLLRTNITCGDDGCVKEFEVPKGKRLTLTYVSAAGGDLSHLVISQGFPIGGPKGPFVPAVKVGDDKVDFGIVSEEILFVAEPGSTVRLGAFFDAGVGSFFTASAYLAGSLSDA